MPAVKKLRRVSLEIIDKNEFVSALEIHPYGHRKAGESTFREQNERVEKFKAIFHNDYFETVASIRMFTYLDENTAYVRVQIHHLYDNYASAIQRVLQRSDNEPMKTNSYMEWVFKGFVYEVKGLYTDDEVRLLILEDFDKERRRFEKLRTKFDPTRGSESSFERPRIPENVRIEVWRRDGGKCARCGSRERLEYDHIVPISKGGSNTARNIELLCEKHNRSKSNNVV